MSGRPIRHGSRTDRGAEPAPRSAGGARSIRKGSLLLLVAVVGVVAAMTLASLAGFIRRPDPTVKAGPMYVTLTLTSISTLLMLVMALSVTYARIVPRRQSANVQLVMWATGLTGLITGLLTLGKDASPIVTRFVFASLAYVFIMLQDARLARARTGAPGPAGAETHPAATPARYRRTRQRRGGRKR